MMSVVKIEKMDVTEHATESLSSSRPSQVAANCNSGESKCIKSLLMSGWRERWSDVQFGLRVKQMLPRGVSGDVYDLSDCILNQSLVGLTPNHLMLSYLTHCVQAGIVSYGAVISSMASYQDFGKTECITCLLDLLISLQGRISCLGHEEQCMKLAVSLVQLPTWLFRCMKQSVVTKQAPQSQSVVIEKCMTVISFFMKNQFLVSMFNVGKKEDDVSYHTFLKSFADFLHVVEHEKPERTAVITAHELAAETLNFKELIDWKTERPYAIVYGQLLMSNQANRTADPTSQVFTSLNAVIAFNAVLTPVSEVSSICDHVLKIARFNDMPIHVLYMEMIRACLIGLVDAGTERSSYPPSAAAAEELKWAAFTFFKIPQILLRLEEIRFGSQSQRPHDDVEQAIEKLLVYSPLLDQTDYRSNCDCIQLLVKELRALNLISDNKKNEIEAKRAADSIKSGQVGKKDPTGPAPAQLSQPSLILKAAPTVTSILKTLDVDYSKKLDLLLNVLCGMQGKSFELIMIAAAATGKLKYFTMKLLMFNEFNKQAGSETGKQSQTRSLIFDITFLMLCQISQNYGVEVITGIPETQNCFFATWCAQCLPQNGAYKCPDMILGNCDPNRVDVLLKQFMRPDFDVMKTDLPKWHEVCINLPAAIKEVLIAWEYGSECISTDIVKQVLDNVKSKMCCLPIVVSAWLCSYISILHYEQRLKPMNMLQQFLVPFVLATPTTETPPASTPDANPQSDHYKERSGLMIGIVKKMMHDLIPAQGAAKSAQISHRLTSKVPLAEILENVFSSIHSKCWLDTRTTHDVMTCVSVGGSEWFVDALVRQLLRRDQSSDLTRAVALVFGLMHVSLQDCASALVNKVIPSYLMLASKQEMLYEPRASALARLTVLTICAAFDLKRNRLMKRDEDLESQLLDTPLMMKRSIKQEDASSDLLMDPFVRSVARLMLLFSHIVSDPEVSQRTTFPILFLEQLILCVKDESRKVLQFLPVRTTIDLLRVSPKDLTFEFLFAVSDPDTVRSRRQLCRSLCHLNRFKRLAI